MASAAFRAYFGTRRATAEELARIEEIVVDQEIDMVWQARVRMTMLLDDDGRWRTQPSALAPPFSRFRAELQLNAGEWVPLIDGIVVGWETSLGRPGSSHARMIVRDDMVLMNREEATEIFRDQTDSELATQIFARFSTLLPGTITATTERPPATVRRGTSIRFLRDLAKANGFHAYVEPGELPGTSLGHFCAPDTAPPSLPPMILFGNDRNLTEASFTEDHESPERTRASTVRFSDQQIVSSQASFQDEALMGALPAISEDTGALRQPPPDEIRRENPDAVVRSQARDNSYAHRVEGRVKSDCYSAVLAPYRKVTIRAGDLPQSGDWLLWSVRHRITPMTYTQHFSARRNALSDASGGTARAVPEIF